MPDGGASGKVGTPGPELRDGRAGETRMPIVIRATTVVTAGPLSAESVAPAGVLTRSRAGPYNVTGEAGASGER